MDTSEEERARISQLIQASISELEPKLRSWAEAHLIPPRPIQLVTDLKTGAVRSFWLVTEDTGKNDSGYRVVFDPKENAFGLETKPSGGREWFMGAYGSFADSIAAM